MQRRRFRLRVKRVADRVKVRRSLRRGSKDLGLGIRAFLFYIFETNEYAAPYQRLNDASILATVGLQFSHVPEIMDRLKSGKFRLAEYRRDYHRGTLIKGKKPVRVSFRYDADGNLVDYRNGNRRLNLEEIREICRELGIEDDRYAITDSDSTKTPVFKPAPAED